MVKKNKETEEATVGDLLKKIVSTGLGAASVTEDIVKGMLNELPAKDLVDKIFVNAKTTKEDIVGTIKSAVSEYFKMIDVSKEIEKVLDNYDVDVTANIRFTKKTNNAAKPEKGDRRS
ncbi:hypothetical protein OAB57_01765 [Bacteriovoracaceae bacterium]|nr:hypothetical protein [Bacteriovoracaceae bacterium]